MLINRKLVSSIRFKQVKINYLELSDSENGNQIFKSKKQERQ